MKRLDTTSAFVDCRIGIPAELLRTFLLSCLGLWIEVLGKDQEMLALRQVPCACSRRSQLEKPGSLKANA